MSKYGSLFPPPPRSHKASFFSCVVVKSEHAGLSLLRHPVLLQTFSSVIESDGWAVPARHCAVWTTARNPNLCRGQGGRGPCHIVSCKGHLDSSTFNERPGDGTRQELHCWPSESSGRMKDFLKKGHIVGLFCYSPGNFSV